MKTLIAVPAMDMVPTLFLRSMVSMKFVGEVELALAVNSLVYDARNRLAGKAINGGFDRVLWLDSDMDFQPDLMERLSQRLDEGREYVSGFYVSRKAPVKPVIYKEVGWRGNVPFCDPVTEWDGIIEVAGTGFGAVMMTTDLIRRVVEANNRPFTPIEGFGEDLSFCLKVSAAGVKMYCDTDIKLGHVGLTTFTDDLIEVTKK